MCPSYYSRGCPILIPPIQGRARGGLALLPFLFSFRSSLRPAPIQVYSDVLVIPSMFRSVTVPVPLQPCPVPVCFPSYSELAAIVPLLRLLSRSQLQLHSQSQSWMTVLYRSLPLTVMPLFPFLAGTGSVPFIPLSGLPFPCRPASDSISVLSCCRRIPSAGIGRTEQERKKGGSGISGSGI